MEGVEKGVERAGEGCGEGCGGAGKGAEQQAEGSCLTSTGLFALLWVKPAARVTACCFRKTLKRKSALFSFLKISQNIGRRKVVNVESKGKARLMIFILLSEQTKNLDEKQL